ncbi:MGMT family protein [Candidatus Leptofilum sp.]|uniref:MGMT family protein n=1 Tax=Candidatus Leptofilum sp. TaxID=3241576 RepID=UPI003B5A386A
MNNLTPPNPAIYYEQVWQLTRQIPRGRVATYGQLAQLIPCPANVDPDEYHTFGARWVGSAMSACPADVPWQRVINSQGKISQRPGAEMQRQLLENEGIPFVKDKIDLRAYQWRGPGEEELPQQAKLF